MWWKLFFVVVAAVVVQHVFKLMSLASHTGHIHRHQPGPCELVPDIDHGSEDMQALPDGKVFITSGLGMYSDPPEVRVRDNKGRVLLLDLASTDRTPKSLPITGGFNRSDFHPHGLSLWQDHNTGSIYLYVVNHPIGGDRIEKFRYDVTSESLEYIRSFGNDKAIGVINDLRVTGEDQFYYTNSMYSSAPMAVMVELYLLLSWGSVVYFDGQNHHVVVDGLFSPNGINMSPDGRFVYVAMLMEKTIHVYSRRDDNSLSHHNVIPLHTAPDNIDVDPGTGTLYLGCHPVLGKLMSHMEQPSQHTAPSQVLVVKVKDGEMAQVKELYAEEGDVISGSSIAIYRQGQLLIGTVRHKMLRCTYN